MQITSAKRSPCGSNCKAIPCRISSINSSNRRNLMAHNDRQSLQYTPISSSRDLSKSIENLLPIKIHYIKFVFLKNLHLKYIRQNFLVFR